MAESTDRTPRGEGPRRLDVSCWYCPMSGADICVGVIPSASGPGHSVYAHQACADNRGLHAVDPAGSTS